MRRNQQTTTGAGDPPPRAHSRRPPRSGFTLVELLVVITIIAILAGLLVIAAVSSIGTASRTRIVAEMNQFNGALEDYKNTAGSYPPNTQTDAIADNPHLNNDTVLASFRRHLKKVAPQHREPSALIEALVGAGTGSNPNLPGGMNAAEALVFWLGGFSDDPKFPISGVGGPSYLIETGTPAVQQDPVENRNWRLDLNFQNLGPRDGDGFFNESDNRFIVYDDPRPGFTGQQRRINFWYLRAPGSTAPYVYFDASRGSSVTGSNDPPAAVRPSDTSLRYGDDALEQLYFVHAVKRRKTDASDTEPFVFANDGKFQLLHAGLDEEWGDFPMVSPVAVDGLINSRAYHLSGDTATNQNLLFPEGPWTPDLADNLATFAEGTLEDAQP